MNTFRNIVNQIEHRQNAGAPASYLYACSFSFELILLRNIGLRQYMIHILYIGDFSNIHNIHFYIRVFSQWTIFSVFVFVYSFVSCPFASGTFYHSRHIMKMNRKNGAFDASGDLQNVAIERSSAAYTILFIAMTAGVLF